MTAASEKTDILRTLETLHTAQKAHDLDAMVQQYAARGFASRERMRQQFESMIEQNAFRSRTADLAECEVFVHGNYAVVKPVVYRSSGGNRYFSFHLHREDTGWFIIDNHRSAPRNARHYSDELAADAGKVVGERGMLWIRRLPAPVEEVWRTISTSEGIGQWWIVPSVELDLRPGGLFKHHWTNTVHDFREHEFIDFIGAPGDESSPDQLMRLALEPDGDGTVFSFLDSFEGAPSPLTLPWTASGWHCMVNDLEKVLGGRTIHLDFGLGGEFYWRYLRNYHRIADLYERRLNPAARASDWRRAYLNESL